MQRKRDGVRGERKRGVSSHPDSLGQEPADKQPPSHKGTFREIALQLARGYLRATTVSVCAFSPFLSHYPGFVAPWNGQQAYARNRYVAQGAAFGDPCDTELNEHERIAFTKTLSEQDRVATGAPKAPDSMDVREKHQALFEQLKQIAQRNGLNLVDSTSAIKRVAKATSVNEIAKITNEYSMNAFGVITTTEVGPEFQNAKNITFKEDDLAEFRSVALTLLLNFRVLPKEFIDASQVTKVQLVRRIAPTIRKDGTLFTPGGEAYLGSPAKTVILSAPSTVSHELSHLLLDPQLDSVMTAKSTCPTLGMLFKKSNYANASPEPTTVAAREKLDNRLQSDFESRKFLTSYGGNSYAEEMAEIVQVSLQAGTKGWRARNDTPAQQKWAVGAYYADRFVPGLAGYLSEAARLVDAWRVNPLNPDVDQWKTRWPENAPHEFYSIDALGIYAKGKQIGGLEVLRPPVIRAHSKLPSFKETFITASLPRGYEITEISVSSTKSNNMPWGKENFKPLRESPRDPHVPKDPQSVEKMVVFPPAPIESVNLRVAFKSREGVTQTSDPIPADVGIAVDFKELVAKAISPELS